MLAAGQLPLASILPSEYEVVACDHYPETRFCDGMGRHFIDLPTTVTDPTFSRQPNVAGDDGVIYGEAAGRLIFIEYVFGQQDFVDGVLLACCDTTGWSPYPSRRQRPHVAFRNRRVDARTLHGAHVLPPRGNLSRLGNGAFDPVARVLSTGVRTHGDVLVSVRTDGKARRPRISGNI